MLGNIAYKQVGLPLATPAIPPPYTSRQLTHVARILDDETGRNQSRPMLTVPQHTLVVLALRYLFYIDTVVGKHLDGKYQQYDTNKISALVHSRQV